MDPGFPVFSQYFSGVVPGPRPRYNTGYKRDSRTGLKFLHPPLRTENCCDETDIFPAAKPALIELKKKKRHDTCLDN